MSAYRIHNEVEDIGEHNRQWRMVLSLCAQQVCQRAGISRDTLRKIEQGDSSVSSESVWQVMRALGVLDRVVEATDPLGTDLGRLRAHRLTRKRVR
ncbi:helix-turn-helix domain-containing protein [Corynebacterium cystitidis]|uniref:helix-turn-helix domain-containing protein n=1 Tax=Corynebacterium cystitidis TaxID=35757 RepID=UPI00211E99CC|nr:helix-turn-helix domain-containing protein [Corynebacterium cystitidis]